MLDMDAAFEKAVAIVNEALNSSNRIQTEEETKIRIISRLLTECLNWSFSDIKAETKHDNGYSDYILLSGGEPALLVEAKRVGSIEIRTAEKEKLRHLKISGPALNEAVTGIEQATSYALPNGLPIAILTDGLAWIVFKTFVRGTNYKSKEAFVFPSPNALLRDFATFYDLVSKTQFGKKLYNPIFDKVHQKRLLLTQALVSPISEGEIKLVRKTDLAFDLERVFESFFARLTGEHDDELLIECFVETRESRIADFSLEKITASVLGNLSPVDRDVDEELASLIESTVEVETGQAESGETVFIVGPTGAGKSTFLERFFRKTLSSTLRKKCVVTRINCLDATGREDTALAWITEALIKQLEQAVYDGGVPSYDELQGLYHSEYLRRVKGVDAHLYERDKQAFKERFGQFLDEKVESDRDGYLKRILSDIVHNRRKLPIILVDNTDEFSPEFKKNIFQFAQSLRRHAEHAILIFPITDKSAWAFSKTDIYGIYRSRSFFLPTPPPREVFRKRIDFIKQHLSDDISEKERQQYFASRGIRISVNNLFEFARVLETVFVDHDYSSKTIGELTNYNIRKTLLLSQRVITSTVFNIENVLNSFITGEPIAPGRKKFMNALLKGDHELYKPGDEHQVFSIFQVDREISQSPLTALRILALLDAVRLAGKTIEDQHLSAQSIFDYFDSMGSSESAVDRALLSLFEAGLVEPYDPSIRDFSQSQRLAISHSGIAHFRLATNNIVIFEQMALTTSIVNSEAAQHIRSIYLSKSALHEKMDKVRQVFVDYLLAEDKNHFAKQPDSEPYKCQAKLIDQLSKFGIKNNGKYSDQLESIGDVGANGNVASGVIATVDWYDADKKFGFVDIEGIEGQAYLNAERINEKGIDRVAGGDDILCDIGRSEKGLHVSKVHEIETDPNKIEKVDCKIVRLFHDRKYGFVQIKNSKRDAYFHYSILPNDQRSRLRKGLPLKVEIVPDKKGRGWEVKNVISID